MTSSFAKRNAFTLIEIMIVVAVLAILVTTVAVAQKVTITRSKNAKILSAVSQVRKVAEEIYMRESNGYVSVCDSQHLNARDDDLDNLEEEIVKYGGQTFCQSLQNSYCLKIKLSDGQFFCIDDESHFGQTDENACENGESVCRP